MFLFRSFLSFSALLGYFWVNGLPCLAQTSPSDRRTPNILILLADDLGYGDLACYRNQNVGDAAYRPPVIQTPNLDRLARQGVRFTNAHSSAPVCSPSRAGLLTGRIPTRMGIHDWIPDKTSVYLKQDETTLATLLRQADYQTAFYGKWHLAGQFNTAGQPQPNDHGFQHWYGTEHNALPSHHNPTNFVRNGQPIPKTEGYACQLLADEVIRWTKARNSNRPFFQHVCFHEPHEPVASPAELVKKYGDQTPLERATYYANVENLDRAVGRILQMLDEQNLTDNTLVIFTSDNGPETLNRYPKSQYSYGSAGGLRGMKLHLYEGGTRVPTIMRFPGTTKPGLVSDAPIWNLDFLPTLAALTGVSTKTLPHPLDGENVVTALQGKPFTRSKPLFWYYYNALDKPKMALQVGHWKLLGLTDHTPIRVYDVPKSLSLLSAVKPGSFALYNTQTDPAETTDLALKYPQRVAQMRAELEKLYKETIAESPLWESAGR